ncbi:MAG: NAD-dependent epimerase/dehydratase family protein [Longimicrobiales bacterium]
MDNGKNADLHVVFGAGQVGSHLAEELRDGGFRVRVAKRSPVGIPEGVEPVLGDAGDADFCRKAAEGAAVVYHCMNPPYSVRLWRELLPRFQQNLVAAAGGTGARLVVLENLYMVGQGGGGPITEDTPIDSRSKKGEIRGRLTEDLFAAHRRGDVRAVSGRASDFYGPRGNVTHFGEQFWPRALAGKPAPFLPNPDTPHTYHFIPDVARGLMTLGLAPEDAVGRPWMLPCVPGESSRALVERFSRALGREIKLRGVPKVAMKVLELFSPMFRELGEMLYQWEVPFVVDDSRFRSAFHARPTDPDVGAAETVVWALDEFEA